MDGFRDIVENKINPHILELFYNTPKTRLIIEPSEKPDGPMALYYAGSLDGKRPGKFKVNTHKFKSQPKYEMVSLSLHEASPGHHLQSSFSLEQDDFPTFRKVMEDRKR